MLGKQVWTGHPSQELNRNTFIVCALTSWLIIPIVYAWFKYRKTQDTVYEVSNYAVSAIYRQNPSANRLLELYRIDSLEIEETNQLAAKGLSNLIIRTKNPNIPPVVFAAIPDAGEVKKTIESLKEESQKKQSIQEIPIPILQAK